MFYPEAAILVERKRVLRGNNGSLRQMNSDKSLTSQGSSFNVDTVAGLCVLYLKCTLCLFNSCILVCRSHR